VNRAEVAARLEQQRTCLPMSSVRDIGGGTKQKRRRTAPKKLSKALDRVHKPALLAAFLGLLDQFARREVHGPHRLPQLQLIAQLSRAVRISRYSALSSPFKKRTPRMNAASRSVRQQRTNTLQGVDP
jgi:hypothetical protein